MALSWLAPKAAIPYGKRTLGNPASLPRHGGRSKTLGHIVRRKKAAHAPKWKEAP
jgi:hypothetical protein